MPGSRYTSEKNERQAKNPNALIYSLQRRKQYFQRTRADVSQAAGRHV